MAKGARAMKGVYVVLVGKYRDWSPNDIGRWLSKLGGCLQSSITDNTTHVVVHNSHWDKQSPNVTKALEINARGEKKAGNLKIVNYDWLEDSLRNTTHRKETAYLWEKIDPTRMPGYKPKEPKGNKKKESGEPRSHVGQMKELLEHSTDPYVDERSRKDVDTVIDNQKALEEIADEEKKAKQYERKRAREEFKRGSKKARNEIFSDNHHIYTDDTGFGYEVLLTKVNTRANSNERYTLTVRNPSTPSKPSSRLTLKLQIYESNIEPHTYAVNIHFAGSRIEPFNNVLLNVGSTFLCAFANFRKAFKAKTNVEWDDRIDAHNARVEKLPGQQKAPADEDVFLYHPPMFGPIGKMYGSWGEVQTQGSEKTSASGGLPAQGQEIQGGAETGAGALDGIGSYSGNGQGDDSAHEPQGKDWGNDVSGQEQTDGNGALAVQDILHEAQGNVEAANHYPFDMGAFPPNTYQQGSFGSNLNGSTDQAVQGSTQFPSFGAAGQNTSFKHGTQEHGETQVAQRAQGELLEYLDRPLFDSAPTIDQASSTFTHDSSASDQSDLHPSGTKRGASEYEHGHNAKKPKIADEEESFYGGQGDGTGEIPGDLFGAADINVPELNLAE